MSTMIITNLRRSTETDRRQSDSRWFGNSSASVPRSVRTLVLTATPMFATCSNHKTSVTTTGAVNGLHPWQQRQWQSCPCGRHKQLYQVT